MVSNCANKRCGKPLHYLRDGRIYIFDLSVGASSPGEKRQRHLEHYWLCGTCAGTLMLVQDSRGSIQVLLKPATIIESDKRLPIVDSMLASS
jgi:hypothetical protein